MLPFELGGVVDSHLVVYGTDNLRVVDAGIMPIIPAAHLQAAVYAVAEKVSPLVPFILTLAVLFTLFRGYECHVHPTHEILADIAH
jgi:hypothetical protein